ncbi:dienelactone hydrolase family protein [Ferrovibrio sp.]|jgi:pimeloyl-ACP methyl ester carboxylesterase|uniref:dienelactone hydrolase family protein n=1 Tax=Ferrovibrio sp. TaxID=1917215 RepID=UPI0035AD9F1C
MIAVPADSLPSETLTIPSRVVDPALARPLTIKASYYPAPATTLAVAPLVVFNHGSTGQGAERGRIPRHAMLRYESQARYFHARGFAFLAPMRRGRGESEGDYLESYAWDALKLAEGLQHALDDVDAVVEFMRRRPEIDGRRILVAGHSRGGLLSVAYAGRHPAGVIGSISFAGGWIAERGMMEDFNREVFVRAGAGAETPSLWLYAENDRHHSMATIRRWHDGYTGAGGNAELYLFGPIEDDEGHQLLERPGLWQSAMDAFLHQLGFFW